MRIVVGLSGGVDSAFAAALLQERGFDVLGCFLKVDLSQVSGFSLRPGLQPRGPSPEGSQVCPWKEDLPMAHRVAAHLNIPLIVKDVSAEYEREVLTPMIAAYQRGETPNPDTTCNRYVKFDALAAVGRDVGAERIATGHYARVARRQPNASVIPSRSEGSHTIAGGNDSPREVELHRALDHSKDQSYFLWMLTQEQLGMCEFPIGEWRKDDVRQEAKRRGFPNWDRDSTSGICFLGQINLAEFLFFSFPPSRGEGEREGEGSTATVITTTGQILGTTPHAEALTIGQRVPIAGQPTPHYVVAVDCSTPGVEHTRRIIVSASPVDPARYTNTIHAHTSNWIGTLPTFPLSCTARIRHRQEPVSCVVSVLPSSFRASSEKSHADELPNQHVRSLAEPALSRAEWGLGMTLCVTFSTPLTGVASGQAVVFTDGDRVLGGAHILRA